MELNLPSVGKELIRLTFKLVCALQIVIVMIYSAPSIESSNDWKQESSFQGLNLAAFPHLLTLVGFYVTPSFIVSRTIKSEMTALLQVILFKRCTVLLRRSF